MTLPHTRQPNHPPPSSHKSLPLATHEGHISSIHTSRDPSAVVSDGAGGVKRGSEFVKIPKVEITPFADNELVGLCLCPRTGYSQVQFRTDSRPNGACKETSSPSSNSLACLPSELSRKCAASSARRRHKHRDNPAVHDLPYSESDPRQIISVPFLFYAKACSCMPRKTWAIRQMCNCYSVRWPMSSSDGMWTTRNVPW